MFNKYKREQKKKRRCRRCRRRYRHHRRSACTTRIILIVNRIEMYFDNYGAEGAQENAEKKSLHAIRSECKKKNCISKSAIEYVLLHAQSDSRQS